MPAADGGWDQDFCLMRFRVRGLLAVGYPVGWIFVFAGWDDVRVGCGFLRVGGFWA